MNYEEASIPVKLHKRHWVDLESNDEIDKVRDWVDDFPDRWLAPNAKSDEVGKGLLLYGDTGTGKTTAAGLALKCVLDGGKWGWFVPMASLENLVHRQMDLSTYMRKVEHITDDIQEAFEAVHRRLEDARRRYFVVVLDDWGRERMASTFMNDYVEGLLRERFNRGLPSILTTNLSDEGQIEMALSRPFVSFLSEAFTFIDFGKQDRR